MNQPKLLILVQSLLSPKQIELLVTKSNEIPVNTEVTLSFLTGYLRSPCG